MQQFRVLVVLVENPALAPGTHMVAHSSSSRELTRSFGLLGQQACTWHTDIHAGNTHTHIHTHKHTQTHTHTNTHTHTKQNKKKEKKKEDRK